MGTCCSNRNDKLEIKNEFTVKPLINQRIMDSNHLLSLTQENQYQTNEFYALNLSRIIASHPELHIEEISLDKIWNIIRAYQNDFTATDYIIYDLRQKAKRKENCFKKFRCINYSLNEIETFPENRMNQLSKYLNCKKIIIINQDEDAILCEKFIEILINYDIKVKSIYVLNTLLNEDVYQDSMNQLYSRMDDRWFIYYPYVLLTLKSFSYFKSLSYIFIDRTISHSDNELLSSLNDLSTNNSNSKYDQFIKTMNVKVILYLSGDEDQLSISLLPIGLTLIKIDPNMNIKNNKSVCQIIEITKNHLLGQGSFVILYRKDISITDIIIVKWIINLLNQLTYYSLNEIKNIVATTLAFLINDIGDILKSVGDDNFFLLKSEMTHLNDIKDKFDIYLSRLKNQISNYVRFKSICSIMEKIILNILTHPGDNVYYNIKCESNTFKVNISIYEYAKMAFETFGFKLNKGNDGEYYILNIDTDIDCLREIYFCFIHSVQKIIISYTDNSELDDLSCGE